MGGDRRPGAPGARQRDVGRRHQPPEPRPGRPRPEDQEADEPLRRGGLARRRGEVRLEAAGCVREAGRRRAPPAHRRHVERAVPVPVRSDGPGAARAVPRRRRARRSLHSWTSTATTTSPPSCRTSPATISPSSSDCYRRCDEVTDRPSVVFAYTVKGWGLPDRRRPAQPRRAAATPAQIDDLPTVTGAHARIGVGPLRTRHERRIAVLRRRAARCNDPLRRRGRW